MIFNYICLSVHTWDAWVCLGMCVEVRGPQFSPFMLWILGGANSGFQVWHKFLLPTEPFCQLLKCFNLFFINYFIHLHSKYWPPSWSYLPEFFTPSHPLSLWEGAHPTLWHPPSLGHHVSTELGSSSPTEARQGIPLLHMCQGHQNSSVFPLAGGLVFGSSQGSRLVDTVVLPMGLSSLSAPSSLPLTLP